MASNKNESGKLILAVGLLIVAGGVVAWYQGWILGGGSAPQADPAAQAAKQKEFDAARDAAEKDRKDGKALPPIGS